MEFPETLQTYAQSHLQWKEGVAKCLTCGLLFLSRDEGQEHYVQNHLNQSEKKNSNGSLVEHSPSENLNTCVFDESYYCIPQRRQEPECESGTFNFSTSMSTNLSEESVDYIEPTQL